MLNNKNFFDNTTQSINHPSHVNLISLRLKLAGSDFILITKARNFFDFPNFLALTDVKAYFNFSEINNSLNRAIHFPDHKYSSDHSCLLRAI